jgi:hypothetical protein
LKPAVLQTLLPPSSYLFSVGYPLQHWPPLGYSGMFGSEYATGNATKVPISQSRSPYSDVTDVFGRIHEHVKLARAYPVTPLCEADRATKRTLAYAISR